MRYLPALSAVFLLVAACERELPGDDNMPAPDREDPGDAVPSPEPEDPAVRHRFEIVIE
ncbi:MAG: hypothetical protein RIC52_06240 [Amphiplicatus sp.]